MKNIKGFSRDHINKAFIVSLALLFVSFIFMTPLPLKASSPVLTKEISLDSKIENVIFAGKTGYLLKENTEFPPSSSYKSEYGFYDYSNKKLWGKILNYNEEVLNSFCFSDESYLLQFPSKLVKFDSAGNEQWRLPSEADSKLNFAQDENFNLYLFTTKSYINEFSSSGVTISKINNSGNIIKENHIEDSTGVIFHKTVYDEKIGLVVSGRSSSKTGIFDVSTKPSRYYAHFISVFNPDSLELNWIQFSQGFYMNNLDTNFTVIDGYIYALKRNIQVDINNVVTKRNASLIQINSAGENLWEVDFTTGNFPEFNGIYPFAIYLAPVNNQIGVILNPISHISNTAGDSIVFIDKDGNTTNQLHELELPEGKLFPTDDGGFFAYYERIAKTLPHPPYTSVLPYDMETVVYRYDSQLNLIWENVYDTYPDEEGEDILFFLPSGIILH